MGPTHLRVTPPPLPFSHATSSEDEQAEWSFCETNLLAQPSLRMAAEARVWMEGLGTHVLELSYNCVCLLLTPTEPA